MPRYMKEFPMVDCQENSYAEIQRFLTSQKYKERVRDGEQLFQKGDGFWVAPSFVKVSYSNNTARLEAWVDVLCDEQGLDGTVGGAVKKTLKKIVDEVEKILQKPGVDYMPQEDMVAPVEETILEAAPQQKPMSKKEFFAKHAGESFYMHLKVYSIFAYVLCGINLALILINPLAIVDCIILLGLTLGMHLGRSKGCAIALTIYSGISVAIGLVASGTPSGWAWLIVGICIWKVFNNTEKRYQKMLKNG